MGRNSIVYNQDPTRWYSGKFVQIEKTWVWSIQNCVRNVRHTNSSEDVDAQLSEVEVDQKLRLRNFDAGHEKIETRAVVLSRRGLSGAERGRGICYQWREKRHCSNGSQCSFWHASNDRAKPTPKTSPPSEPPTSKTPGRSASRKRNVSRVKYFLKGTCTKSPCKCWHRPECQFYKFESSCKFGAECSFAHKQVEGQPSKKPKKGDDKSAVAILKSVQQLSCVSQGAEPPESAAISRKDPKVLGPFDEYDSRGPHCVKRTSEKIKVHRLVKYKWNFLISADPTLWNLRISVSDWDWKTGAMRPRRCVDTCQEYP